MNTDKQVQFAVTANNVRIEISDVVQTHRTGYWEVVSLKEVITPATSWAPAFTRTIATLKRLASGTGAKTNGSDSCDISWIKLVSPEDVRAKINNLKKSIDNLDTILEKVNVRCKVPVKLILAS